MGTVRRFEELETWQTARELVKVIYALTQEAAFGRDFDLRSQIRRAAISVISNIAEGFDSRTQALFIDQLGRAKGSAAEVRSQLWVAFDLTYITPAQFDMACELTDKVGRQIYRLMEYLESLPTTRRIREESVEYNV